MNKFKPATYKFEYNKHEYMVIHVDENGKVSTDSPDGRDSPLVIYNESMVPYQISINDVFNSALNLNSTTVKFLGELYDAYILHVAGISLEPKHPVDLF